MSRATRIGSAVAGFVVAAGMLAAAPPAHAESAQVQVEDMQFTPKDVTVIQGEDVVFDLAPNATASHSFTLPALGYDEELNPQGPGPKRFTFSTKGLEPKTYAYGCRFHWQSHNMVGTITVQPAAVTTTSTEPTTTTTAPPTTTTTAPQTTTTTPTTAPTSTTRPPTTSTTRPPTTTAPTTATTAPPTTATTAKPTVSGASEPVTTTTKKKTTPTTKKDKKSTTSTAPVVEETTTTMLPSLAAQLPGTTGGQPTGEEVPEVTEAGEGEEAASWVGEEKGGKGGGRKKKAMMALGGIGLLGLGGAAWSWHNRSSKYMPA
jgi:hypothetical protein